MDTIKTYKLFIASPGDVAGEREIVREVTQLLNGDPLVKEKKILLECYGWEEELPQAGYPQDIINEKAEDTDLFVFIFHKRYGNPTRNADSATFEEFKLAYEKWLCEKDKKDIGLFLYFKNIMIGSLKDLDDPQIKKIFEFKEMVKDYTKYPVLYKGFDAEPDFRTQFTEDLKKWIAGLESSKKSVSSKKPVPPPVITAQIPAHYKNYLLTQCQYMDIENLRKGPAVLLKLPEVYVPLYTTNPEHWDNPQMIKEKEMKEQKDVDIEEFASKSTELVIKGGAGSGKTTMVKHIAYTIIKKENPYGLNEYLPVLIYFKDLKTIVEELKADFASPKKAEAIMKLYFEKTDNGLCIEIVKAYCEKGKALFLLDGLDEANIQTRNCVVDSFYQFLSSYKNNKIIFTGRPHGFDGKIVAHYHKKDIEVLELNNDQINAFVSKSWKAVHEQKDKMMESLNSPAALIADLADNEHIDQMKTNPLLLTAICLLYLDNRKLPDQRAELYDCYIDRLLAIRFHPDDIKIKRYFMELAYEMFIKGDRGIERHAATVVLKSHFPMEKEKNEHDYAIQMANFFDRVEAASGLMKNENGEYRFSHLSIQEFLAAAWVMDMDNAEIDFYKRIEGFVDDPPYTNLILLYVGLLSMKNNSGSANRIVKILIDEKNKSETSVLGGLALLDMHKNYRRSEIITATVSRMKSIIANKAEPKILASAGEILGWIGDDRDLTGFVKIKGGQYKLEKLGKVKLVDYEIGQYPVTNSWYKGFMEAGGYSKKEYWTDSGWNWKEKNNITEPRYWNDRKWNCPNHPVVGVSWYEAAAFCKWMTESRKDKYEYCLPTEQQWQLAAAGKNKNKYAWGNDWDKNKCNNGELDIDKTTAVGVFMNGNTGVDEIREEALSDMMGNVWEWTNSLYANDSQRYIVRGGAWYDDGTGYRCAYRLGDLPDSRLKYFGVGFRCARILHF